MNRRFALRNISLSGLGVALSPALVGVLESCQPAYDPGYVLRALSPTQDRLLAHLVEFIIPTTDTPGAKAAGVNQYIDRVLALLSDSNEKETLLKGLDKLNQAGFLEHSNKDQTKLLESLEKSLPDSNEKEFFDLLKGMTIFGYYTSEIGASQELRYIHASGYYDGEYPFEKVGKNFY